MAFSEFWSHDDMKPHLEEFRQELAKTFGVTVQENCVTLRKTINGTFKTLSLIATEVTTDEPACDDCSRTLRGTSYKQVEQRIRDKTKYNVELILCYDCYCPQ